MKDDWMESKTLQELLENNIQSLYGRNIQWVVSH
jgi:hypothetical protein